MSKSLGQQQKPHTGGGGGGGGGGGEVKGTKGVECVRFHALSLTGS